MVIHGSVLAWTVCAVAWLTLIKSKNVATLLESRILIKRSAKKLETSYSRYL